MTDLVQSIAPGLGAEHEVRAAVASGLSFTCAMCTNFWNAYRAGKAGCGKDCTGPYGGRDFPMYHGPLLGPQASMVCFHCGENSVAAFRVGNGRVLGCCTAHKERFKDWTPPGVRPRKGFQEARIEVLER